MPTESDEMRVGKMLPKLALAYSYNIYMSYIKLKCVFFSNSLNKPFDNHMGRILPENGHGHGHGGCKI